MCNLKHALTSFTSEIAIKNQNKVRFHSFGKKINKEILVRAKQQSWIFSKKRNELVSRFSGRVRIRFVYTTLVDRLLIRVKLQNSEIPVDFFFKFVSIVAHQKLACTRRCLIFLETFLCCGRSIRIFQFQVYEA